MGRALSSKFTAPERPKTGARSKPIRVYSLGYQQINLDTCIATLLSSGVGVVLDVRETGSAKQRVHSWLESCPFI
jgi:hypothetical protein